MISKAQAFLEKQLKVIEKIYKVPLLTEVKEGNKRYDFYFPTNPPVVVECNGKQHTQDHADGFFFKSSKQLLDYKKNDSERKLFDKIGKIILIEYTDEEFPDIDEIIKDLTERNAIKVLEKGPDENNAYYSRIVYNQKQSERRKEFNREFRKKLKEKQKSNSWNRLK